MLTEIENKAEELSSGGTLHDDEGYIVLPPAKWEILKEYILSKILEAVDGAGLTPEQQFNLHFDTPYSCKSARMSAFLKGADGGAQAMKQAIKKAIEGEK